jgi:pimeloyl-ACP methyl ester carboxylesterase
MEAIQQTNTSWKSGVNIGINPVPTPYDKQITVGGVTYYYREYPGEKRDIVLVHGMPSSSYTWNEVIPHLTKEGYRVWCMDLKGFGWTEKPLDTRYDVFVIAEELNAFLESVGLSHAVVVGHSWGALLCMVLAIDHPDKVDDLVLIDSVSYPQKAPAIMQLARLPFAGRLAGLVMRRWLLKNHMKDLFFDRKKVTDEKVDAYFNPMRTPNMLNAQVEIIRQLLDKENESYVENYPKISARTLIISGADDRWISPAMSNRLQKDIRNSTVAFVPKCGHFPQEESPAYTSRLILDFIEGGCERAGQLQ